MERPPSSSSSSSSSPNEEEEDLRNLLDESDSQIDAAEQRPPPTFDVESLRSRLRRSFFKLNLTKRQCIVIFLPLLLVFVYLSTDLTNYFSSDKVPDSVFRPNHGPEEPDLRALYLLRKQETDLSSLWNRTLSVSDMKSALFRQMSLNRQIQNALLSPHKAESLGLYGGGGCRRVEHKLLKRKTIQWKPRRDKFLFAICLSGQMSNHLICLEKHMFFAALLKRTLVIPSHRFDYHYSRIIDIDRINTCLGRKVVVSFEEFWKSRKKHHHVHIDRFICYFSKPEACYVDKEHIAKLKGLGISIGGKVDSPWEEEDIAKPSNKTAEEVERSFRSDDDVIAIGDVFYANVEREWVMQPGGPLAHKCKTLVEPNRLILLTAQRFIQTFLGRNYVALHFRRHGFLKFCNAKNPSCFYPIPQAAHCIARLVEKVDAPVIYLSTDAAESETGLLQSLLIINGKTVPFVKRPPRDSAEKWDALLYRHGLEGDSQVEAMLDKTICAMSSVFIGASGSTFTEDILRLRKDWGTASVCDEYLCQNEQPNFIADHE
ncbi:O-fucosyltransferase 14-like [Brassica napus]|uniref:O-fucosyltransferase 14-like n=1 Tax=Brassica napus TaxID=3708 RepID=UPI0006AB5203|nr:O-fucosyltransferase 14-like [Brassica napus]